MSPSAAAIAARAARDRKILRAAKLMTIAQLGERFKLSDSAIRHVLKNAGVKAVPAPLGKRASRPAKGIRVNFDEEIRDRNRRLKSNELLAAALRREISASQGAPDA